MEFLRRRIPRISTLATITTQGAAAGIQIVNGAEAIVASMAQSDLIAAGKLLPPVTAPVVVAETPAA